MTRLTTETSKLTAFTIAVGKPIYLTMAVALARSFLVWNKGLGIDFAIVTDKPIEARPNDISDIMWVQVREGEFGQGFRPKLFLDRLAPSDRALFIDADCLCVRSLAFAFDVFADKAVSVIGKHITDGEWFGEVATIKEKLNLNGYPRFNGGIYYLERGEMCTKVFETARNLLPRYDELGFVRLRNSENDEVLMAVAMEIHGQTPVPETGKIMNTLLAAPGDASIDVLEGKAVLRNPKNHPNHNNWYELEEMRPALVHFLGTDIDDHPYRTQILLMELVKGRGWPVVAARLLAYVRSAAPWLIANSLKNALRPAFHSIFGPRPIKARAR